MPVTKKKGAIFAIYADSPPKSGASAAASSSSSAAASSNLLPLRAPSSPTTKRSTAHRTALGSLQPSRTGFPSAKGPLADKPRSLGAKDVPAGGADGGKASLGSSGTTKKPLSSKPAQQPSVRTKLDRENALGTKTTLGLKSGDPKQRRSTNAAPASKRAFEIFSDSSNPPASASSTRAKPKATSSSFTIFTDPVKPAAVKQHTTLRGAAPGPSTLSSTAGPSTPGRKRERAPTPTGMVDKENSGILDSPASRTRSKVHSSKAAPTRALAPKTAVLDKKPSAKRTALRRVDPDMPLSDVSVAYGATREDEPAGFRDATTDDQGNNGALEAL
ncbi:uncharacterized protein EHS24_002798 [Apiotrichum porosum]|uniref:Uncharacterized protein n=1 Tax=Apiotrichum porosum TaxID=105984 RepID=A0A427XFR4_9TREE|nr:uncharacterized protein EHS24_002798 [Apiotrichum porosum]RSH77740.1 hypothetical protein EHS24_002798 [Apiotrichum porosum]